MDVKELGAQGKDALQVLMLTAATAKAPFSEGITSSRLKLHPSASVSGAETSITSHSSHLHMAAGSPPRRAMGASL